MSRRAALVLLVPALVGLLAGAGFALLRAPGAEVVLDDPPASDSAAPADPSDDGPDVGERTPTDRPSPAPSPTEERKRKQTDLTAAQKRLAELGYYAGSIDGEDGPQTRSAVMAFQKVNELSVDGTVGPMTRAALKDPVRPSLRGGEANRIEVDLGKQVLYFVRGGEIERIMPVSSGSGETYETSGGGTARALTPVGQYRIQRHIRGIREAALGILYDPMYFYEGWAIHGSNSVPAYPASHGCVRVTRWDALWLFDRVPIGMQVVLYGGTHTFEAGSQAAGTDAPAGDTPEDSKPTDPETPDEPSEEPEPEPTRKPKPQPTREPEPEPTRDPSDEPQPEPTEAEPSEEPTDD